LAEPQRAGDFLRDILKQAAHGKSRKVYDEALDQILGERLRPHCQVMGRRCSPSFRVSAGKRSDCASTNSFLSNPSPS
jgi:hypothetical protein